MRCDQCQLARIQGLVCHETGCPNSGKTWDEDREQWIKYQDCFECGFAIEVGTACNCTEPIEDAPEYEDQSDLEDLELDEPESEDFDANADRITDFE